MTNPKVTFIIGLPGSGKTTYLDKAFYNKIDFFPFDDWMGWDVWINDEPPKNEFNEDPRYNALIERLSNKEHIVLLSIRFCDHDFLCKSEYYLQSKFPNIEIKRIYFENNPENSIANVKYRDKKSGGGYYTTDNGEDLYYGQHHPNMPIPSFLISLKNIEILSSNYIIPDKYIPVFYPKFEELNNNEDLHAAE